MPKAHSLKRSGNTQIIVYKMFLDFQWLSFFVFVSTLLKHLGKPPSRYKQSKQPEFSHSFAFFWINFTTTVAVKPDMNSSENDCLLSHFTTGTY